MQHKHKSDGAVWGRCTWKLTLCFYILFVYLCFPTLFASVMYFSTDLSTVSEHLALDTQRGLLSKWSTPQPHAMPTSSPSCASNGEMDDTQRSAAFLSILYFSMNEKRWIQPNGTSPSHWGERKWGLEETRTGQPVTIQQWPCPSQAVRDKLKQAKLLMLPSYGVWIMMGEWVTGWICFSYFSSGIKCSGYKTTWKLQLCQVGLFLKCYNTFFVVFIFFVFAWVNMSVFFISSKAPLYYIFIRHLLY